MNQNSTVTEQFLQASSFNQLEDVMDYIDELHSAASEGNSQSFTGLSEVEVMNYLRELIYTAQEAIGEIERTRETKRKSRAKQPVLHIVQPKIERAG